MKSISIINPAITENTEYSIVEAHASFINFKKWVSWLGLSEICLKICKCFQEFPKKFHLLWLALCSKVANDS